MPMPPTHTILCRPWLLSASLLIAAPVVADIHGVVVTRDGTGIENAQVLCDAAGAVTVSDSTGRFTLDIEVPARVKVTHPDYEPSGVDVVSETQDTRITLVAKRQVSAAIDVSTQDSRRRRAPISAATSEIRPQDVAGVQTAVLDLIKSAPGAAENGQGGLFQTYSVRGISRQRILTRLAGVPIVGERRAGVSASFVDPRLLGALEVVRGPTSTDYGVGALGGVIDIAPRMSDVAWADVGGGTDGPSLELAGGWGDDRWQVGLAHREAENGRDPTGAPIHSQYRQTSALLGRVWHGDKRQIQLTLLPSVGYDIGKASTSFPDNVTLYPRERHLVAQLAVHGPESEFTIFAHPNDLITRDLEDNHRNEVESQALDFGFTTSRQRSLGPTIWRLDVDYFARRVVEATERRYEGKSEIPKTTFTSLKDGSRDDVSAHLGVRGTWRGARLSAGTRWTFQRQSNAGVEATEDSAWTGALGAAIPLGQGWEAVANLGTGLRFPSLSEKFFSGTTGRGEVLGNPALRPESSLGLDLGFRWYGDSAFFAVYGFRNEVDDYIERLEVSEGLLTFRNLTSGRLRGFEIESFWEPTGRWHLALSGQSIRGDGANGSGPLADVPADRLRGSARHQRGAWVVAVRLEHRWRKERIGSGEKVIPSVELLGFKLERLLTKTWRLSLNAENLLDESYFNSADRRVPLAAERRVVLTLNWRGRTASK